MRFSAITGPFRISALPAALVGALLAAGCNFFGGEDAKGTEVENEIVGQLFLADGSRAAGASVKIFPVAWQPAMDPGGAAPVTAVADADGLYRVQLSDGQYNVIGEDEGQVSYLDSVTVDRSIRSLPADTLSAPGSIAGIVALQPQHLPTEATVEVLGTYHFSNVDLQGRFNFPRLAAGRYSIRVSVTLEEYTPLYTNFEVTEGRADTLTDTLRPAFTGIPVVMGLAGAYDTASGVARLTWGRVDYPLLSEYAIYRDRAGYAVLSTVPIARVKDTAFSDSLFAANVSQEAAAQIESTMVEYEYRIKARDKSDRTGQNLGYLPLSAPSPSWVRTFLDLAPSPVPRRVSPGDSIHIGLSYRNRTRDNDSLAWRLEGDSSILRSRTGLGKSGKDTLRLAAPGKAGQAVYQASIRDASGTEWKRACTLLVVDDVPVADAGKDTMVSVGMRLDLQGSARQEFGSIVKWEWNIGGKEGFRTVSGPDTSIQLPAAADSAYPCILRVTDDDGFSDSDTLMVHVSPSRRIPSDTLWAFGRPVGAAGSIYWFDGKKPGEIHLMDTSDLSREFLTEIPTLRMLTANLELAGELYVMGGVLGMEFPGDTSTLVEIYSPSLATWKTGPSLLRKRSYFAAAAFEGRLFAAGGRETSGTDSMEVLDPGASSWRMLGPLPEGFHPQWMGVVQDRLIAVITSPFRPARIGVYDVAEDKWTELAGYPGGVGMSPAVSDSALILFGGHLTTWGAGLSNRVHVYDFGAKGWRTAFPMQRTRAEPHAVKIGYRYFLLGGNCIRVSSAAHQLCDDSEVYTYP